MHVHEKAHNSVFVVSKIRHIIVHVNICPQVTAWISFHMITMTYDTMTIGEFSVGPYNYFPSNPTYNMTTYHGTSTSTLQTDRQTDGRTDGQTDNINAAIPCFAQHS